MRGYEPTVAQWFCGDCTQAAVYAERTDRPEDLPEVLSAIPEGWHVTMGKLSKDHSCGREDGEQVDECDCESSVFMARSCDGCDDGLHGDRHAFTLWIPNV